MNPNFQVEPIEQYTIKLVTEKDVDIDFEKLHDLIYADTITTLPAEELSLWDRIDWINNLGDYLSEHAEFYLEQLLDGVQLDVEANDLVIDDISSDFFRFLENLYC